ncbi:MAG: hypothetical protein HC859_15890, partial [Bacteroidia bacterium]|nr:hypothetical protein [Bacteroidia bacterium]
MKHCVIVCSLMACATLTWPATLPTGFVETLVAQNLDPTDIIVAPDGRIFITVKSGRILIIENGSLLTEPFLHMEEQVDNYNERGLGHMVLDPDFNTNHFYYVYYTVKGQNLNRVSRFTATGNFTVPGSEQIIFDMDVMDGTIHNAGAMVFGTDGKLYVSVGEGSNANKAQLINNVLGKILRINSDGTIPTDNPFYNTYSGKNRAIYALGFRNPFTMSMDPVTGKIYANDVGGGAFEEVNEVQAGKNYGWPIIEGMRTTQTPPANYMDPVYAYPHGNGLGAGCAIVGSSFYSFNSYPATSFPAAYRGRYYFADYCNGYIRMLDASGNLVAEPFATNIDRPLAVRVASDGSMYYLARAGLGGGSQTDNTSTNNGTLWKVTFTGSGAPVVSVQPQDVLVPVGEAATFEIRASGTAPFTYQWQKNSVDIPGADDIALTIDNVQLIDDGGEYRCVITNGSGTITSNAATLSVTTNTRPVPAITLTLPNNATEYRGGDALMFSGTAADAEDGALAASKLEWRIDFHHDEHSHPGLSWAGGFSSGAYNIPTVGETASNVWLRVYLRATDSQGLSNTVYEEIFPAKSSVTLVTDPPGIKLEVDGAEVTTPYTFTGVVNLLRIVEAANSQVVGSKLYLFDQWSTGSTTSGLNLYVPEDDQIITATYSEVLSA